jgi:serine/threonine protein kinase
MQTHTVHKDPKPSNYMFDLMPQNKYRIVLGDYGIAETIKDQHFNAQDLKKTIDHDMFRIFMPFYAKADDDFSFSDRRPASENYDLVHATMVKASKQAHVLIDRFFAAKRK